MLRIILFIEEALINISLSLLILLPFANSFSDGNFPYLGMFFNISFISVFLLMIVRPLADIFEKNWLRQLVILRKGLGILSSSIIVGFAMGKIFDPESAYLSTIFSLRFFSLSHFAFFAHLGDVTGLILLITSNVFSQRLLKRNWKRIQRLSYVYFYSGGIYEAFTLGHAFASVALVIVSILTVFAWWVKINRRNTQSIVTIS